MVIEKLKQVWNSAVAVAISIAPIVVAILEY